MVEPYLEISFPAETDMKETREDLTWGNNLSSQRGLFVTLTTRGCLVVLTPLDNVSITQSTPCVRTNFQVFQRDVSLKKSK